MGRTDIGIIDGKSVDTEVGAQNSYPATNHLWHLARLHPFGIFRTTPLGPKPHQNIYVPIQDQEKRHNIMFMAFFYRKLWANHIKLCPDVGELKLWKWHVYDICHIGEWCDAKYCAFTYNRSFAHNNHSDVKTMTTAVNKLHDCVS